MSKFHVPKPTKVPHVINWTLWKHKGISGLGNTAMILTLRQECAANQVQRKRNSEKCVMSKLPLEGSRASQDGLQITNQKTVGTVTGEDTRPTKKEI